jgi:hypothetical protein
LQHDFTVKWITVCCVTDRPRHSSVFTSQLSRPPLTDLLPPPWNHNIVPDETFSLTPSLESSRPLSHRFSPVQTSPLTGPPRPPLRRISRLEGSWGWCQSRLRCSLGFAASSPPSGAGGSSLAEICSRLGWVGASAVLRWPKP